MGKLDDLYETIGGSDTVAKAIDSFYGRVLKDASLHRFFNATDMAQLSARQSMFVSMLLGGQVVYTGKTINAAHARLRGEGLTGEHLDSFLAHFRAALEEAGVKPQNADKVIALLEAQRAAILDSSTASAERGSAAGTGS